MGAIGIRLEDLPLRAQQQALAQLKTAQIQKARKYRNEPEMAEGIRFDSKKEVGRFRELQAMLQAGLIRELRLQQDFTLQEAYTTPDGRRIRAIRYCADFCYERKTQTGWEKIVEDVKSRATRTQTKKERKPFTGTVTYIHPLRRYHVVSFRVRGGVIRESFAGA